MAKVLSVEAKRLAKSLAADENLFKLTNIKGWGGDDLTTADLGDPAFAVFYDSSAKQIEFMKIDPATIADEEITILARGLGYTEDGSLTESADRKLSWTQSTTLVQLGSNPPQLLAAFLSLDSSTLQTINGALSFTGDATYTGSTSGNYNLMNRTAVESLITGLIAGQESVLEYESFAAEDIATGDVVYYQSDGTLMKADKDNAFLQNEGVYIGVSRAAVTNGNGATEGVILAGEATPINTDAPLVAGSDLYIGDDGQVTQTEPVNAIRIGIVDGSGNAQLSGNAAKINDTNARKGTEGIPTDTNRFVTDQHAIRLENSIGVTKWDSAVTYSQDDLVTRSASIWISKEDSNLNNEPQFEIVGPKVSTYVSKGGYTLPASATERDNATVIKFYQDGTLAAYVNDDGINRFLQTAPASVPYELSSIDWSVKKQLSLSNSGCQGFAGAIGDHQIAPDGTYVLTAGADNANNNNLRVERWNMATPFDIDTASTTPDSSGVVNGLDSLQVSISENCNFICSELSTNGDFFTSAELTTPGDPTTVTGLGNRTYGASGGYAITFSKDATHLMVFDNNTDTIYVQEMSTPGVLSTATTVYSTTTNWTTAIARMYFHSKTGDLQYIPAGSNIVKTHTTLGLSDLTDPGVNLNPWKKITN